MKILVLKETKTHKPDLMGCAATEAFSLLDDIVTTATIQVGGILKTVTAIKELAKQYQPDIVVAQKMLASIVLFELPKSIRKIIIDPYLLFDNGRDAVALAMIMKYGSIRLNNWLDNASEKFRKNPQAFGIDNCFCIAQNYSIDQRIDGLFAGTSNIVLVNKSENVLDTLSTYHRALNQARSYLDPNFELPNLEELIKE